MTFKREAKADFGFNTDIAENGGPSNDRFVADLHEKADGNFSAKSTLRRVSAEIVDKNAFKEVAAYCDWVA